MFTTQTVLLLLLFIKMLKENYDEWVSSRVTQLFCGRRVFIIFFINFQLSTCLVLFPSSSSSSFSTNVTTLLLFRVREIWVWVNRVGKSVTSFRRMKIILEEILFTETFICLIEFHFAYKYVPIDMTWSIHYVCMYARKSGIRSRSCFVYSMQLLIPATYLCTTSINSFKTSKISFHRNLCWKFSCNLLNFSNLSNNFTRVEWFSVSFQQQKEEQKGNFIRNY